MQNHYLSREHVPLRGVGCLFAWFVCFLNYFKNSEEMTCHETGGKGVLKRGHCALCSFWHCH